VPFPSASEENKRNQDDRQEHRLTHHQQDGLEPHSGKVFQVSLHSDRRHGNHQQPGQERLQQALKAGGDQARAVDGDQQRYGKTPTFVATDLGMSLYNEVLKLSKTEAQRFLQAKAMDSITIWEKRA
jgi:hypothetical protein